VWQGSAGNRRPYADLVAKGLPTAGAHLSGASGGRTWWAHFALTRINITPTILPKKFEERPDIL